MAFAKTEIGSQIITMFAEKGQKIEELGFEATENGSLHEAGLDLTIKGTSMGEGSTTNGNYERETDSNSGRSNLIVSLNSDINWNNGGYVENQTNYHRAELEYKYGKISKDEYLKAKRAF